MKYTAPYYHACGLACINCLERLEPKTGIYHADGNVGPFCVACDKLLRDATPQCSPDCRPCQLARQLAESERAIRALQPQPVSIAHFACGLQLEDED